jgi:hypothetical protein
MTESLELKQIDDFKYGIKISDDIQTDDFRKRYIETSLQALVNEFNIYTNATKQVPWWFNERALLGFYTSGLVRNTKNSILQEYSCYRGKRNGRADLWVYVPEKNKRIVLESKLEFFNMYKFNENWSFVWENEAIEQAKEYAKNEPNVDYVGCLYFYSLYCKTDKDMENNIDKWLNISKFPNANDSNGYFYAFFRLLNYNNKAILYKYDDCIYPALCITGILKNI